jgi:prophage regulatory protein
MTATKYNYVRKPQVLKRFNFGSTALHDRVITKRFTSPLNCGGNVSAYLEHEVDAMAAAYAIGLNDEQMKELVLKLEAQRVTEAQELLKSLKFAG